MSKPDFIIMGAMKSATSTLHAQLALQDGIFMSTPKEPNYFSDDAEYARGEDWYQSLFSDASDLDICGESSTHYTKLPDYPLTLERMAKQLEKPKLIYMVRHPVDRLVSHYIHQWSRNKFKCEINSAIEEYSELVSYSCYAKQLKPYVAHYGRENILVVFMESIKNNPQELIERVADFIGFSGQVQWRHDLAKQNVSKERIRIFPGYGLLIDSDFMVCVRRNFIPQVIRDYVKKRLSKQKRPNIDAKRLEYLIEIFDQDLQELGLILGQSGLTCENYKQVALGRPI